MNKNKNVKIFKLIIMIIAIAIAIGLIIYLFPIMKEISTSKGQMKFKEKINETGIIGMLLLFGLQVAQIFLIILPGEPIEILAGMCYGSIGGTIFILGSVFITTSGIYFLVRKLGKKFVYDFCDKEKVKKIENSKIFKNPKKVETIMMILFLIPGTPKDLLVYIGGLLPIKPIKFILISTFLRLPSVISSTIAGENLVAGNWKTSILAYVITFALTAIFVWIFNKLDKNKITEEALKTVK